MFPLGNFNPSVNADLGIVKKAKYLFEQLPVAPQGSLTRCYLHWTVAPLGMCFADYNAEARFVNGEWKLTVTHNPLDNAPGLNGNAEASHTYMRNTGAVGIAITGMDGSDVDEHNFGEHPVTVTGLTHLCAAAAAFCKRYEIDVSGTSTHSPYAGEHNILTHAEAGDATGDPAQYSAYGPHGDCERWDLLTFSPVPEGESFKDSSQCGDALRKMIHTYKLAIE